jgi:ectoine hydroxylase-related dioxygenase (phytanoyl-CoA dioxygenase family)
MNKKYYDSISSKDFENISEDMVSELLHKTPPPLLENCFIYKNTTNENKNSLQDFHKNGFAILKNHLPTDLVEKINDEVQEIIDSRKIKFKWNHKIMFAIHHSKLIREVGNDKYLKELLNYCINGNAKLFQSINFTQGSEQATHSDSIHMTTFPQGGLLGVWIALEDIDLDNGPLHYYPESHLLPYYMNKDYGNEGNNWLIGDKPYTAYEKMIEQKVSEKGIQKQIYTAKKGDLLIWHANLLHGGEPHTNKDKSRKSMVFHYFRENSICYHEINQRPAIIKTF